MECGIYVRKVGEMSMTLKRHCVDICCLQEVRRKGQGGEVIGNGFKFLWSGGCKAENAENCECNSCQLVNWEGCGSLEV